MISNDILNYYNKFRRIFFFAIILAITIFIISLLMTNHSNPNVVSNVILERYNIMITLLAIPITLKLFHSKVTKLNKAETKKFILKYQKYYFYRLTIIVLICFLNIGSLWITGSKNFIFMSIISIFALFLTAPQVDQLQLEKDDEENEIDIE